MGSERYDEALIQILQAEGKVVPFLDVIFGFLQRRTDFFHEHARPSSMGFPPGVAEQLVVTTFRKWREVQRANAAVPPAVAEEEVVTSPAGVTSSADSGGASKEAATDTKRSGDVGAAAPPPPAEGRPRPAAARSAAETHNGAARATYSWSQTICDLTVQVPVPAEVVRARQVAVQLRPESVSVGLAAGAELMSGRLHRPVRAEESSWSLLPGDCVQLSLEKTRECWWKALLEDEPEIDLQKIEAVKPWEELSQEEQMKVSELRAREEAKRRGAPAPGGGADVTALLREAWDAEGSPFRGQPYDPSSVQIIPRAPATGDSGQ
ncbi:nudC domain-containing protein 3-like isoform X2 [Amphibalanus amphitrite]|uniref:nudC domain-containing protein 3-like isoform X2 n=1 Tax=Amphibalanus amphitrite TaxID=1232801 RepID=UPI001C910B44|nr:nudC domain-containing protein 3-like isoform X2 [Amphibalanus amphitrite]XP_043206643.1 nudC domain-containing protein 3-like isoform X2 [Amphibalanus amphitrite]